MNITRSKINPAKLRVACAASLALFAVSAGAAETKAEPSRSETEEKLQAAQKRLEEAARDGVPFCEQCAKAAALSAGAPPGAP